MDGYTTLSYLRDRICNPICHQFRQVTTSSRNLRGTFAMSLFQGPKYYEERFDDIWILISCDPSIAHFWGF